MILLSFNKASRDTIRVSNGSVVADLLFILTPIVRVCNFSIFCCTLLYVPFSFSIILMGKRVRAGCFA